MLEVILMSFYYSGDNSFSEQYMRKEKISTIGANCTTFSFDGFNPDNHNLSVFLHHHHEVFELIYITEGEFLITLEDDEYHLKKGDILLMNPFEIHYGEWIPNGVYNEYICLTFKAQGLLQFKNSNLYKLNEQVSSGEHIFENYIPADSEAGKEVGKFINDLNTLSSESNAISECKITGTLYLLLATLLEKCYTTTGEGNHSTRNIEFIRQVTKYLNEHYTEPISTADISKALFMTSSRFCNAFRQNFDMNLANYLCKFRVIRASELYKNEKISLTEISARVGFLDYNYFSKVFKRYLGQTPARYFGRWSK